MEAHRRGPFKKERINKNPLGPDKPFAKGNHISIKIFNLKNKIFT